MKARTPHQPRPMPEPDDDAPDGFFFRIVVENGPAVISYTENGVKQVEAVEAREYFLNSANQVFTIHATEQELKLKIRAGGVAVGILEQRRDGPVFYRAIHPGNKHDISTQHGCGDVLICRYFNEDSAHG